MVIPDGLVEQLKGIVMALLEINDNDSYQMVNALRQLGDDCKQVADKTDDSVERVVFQQAADRWNDVAERLEAALDASDASPRQGGGGMTMTDTRLAERLNRLDCILQDVERFGIHHLDGEWEFAHSALEDARELLGGGKV